jgi:hypothetical protein
MTGYSSMWQLMSGGAFWIVGLALAACLAFRFSIQDKFAPGDVDPESARLYLRRLIVASALGLAQFVTGTIVVIDRGVPWGAPLFALGFAIIIILTTRNRRHRHAGATLRRVVDFADAALTGTLLAGILIVANVLAFQFAERPIDLTREKSYTLSGQSLSAIKNLKRKVKFTVYLANREQGARVRELLELFKSVGGEKISVEFLDRYSDPVRFDALLQRVRELATTQGGGIVIDYGEGEAATTVLVRDADMFAPAMTAAGDPYRSISTFNGEEVITTTILRLEEGKKVRIGFVSGHGEPSLDDVDSRSAGMGLLKSRIEQGYMEAVKIDLIAHDVPPDLALVVFAGPSKPLKDVEVARLRTYVDNGGKLILACDGRVKTGLEEWLKTYNIEISPEIVTDPTYHYGNAAFVLAPIPPGSTHPIVAPLANSYVLVRLPSPLIVYGTIAPPGSKRKVPSATNPARVPSVILSTSSRSRAYPDVKAVQTAPDKFEAGPFPVGVAVSERPGEKSSKREPTPRLVVMSCSNVFDNLMIVASQEYNLDLFGDAVNWLRDRSELASVAPKRHVAERLRLADARTRSNLIVVPTVMSLTVVVCLGVFVFLSRRD